MYADVAEDKGSILTFKKGDLIILDEDTGEMVMSSGWCYGTCAKTGQSGDFPAECVYVLPTVTRPPADILVRFYVVCNFIILVFNLYLVCNLVLFSLVYLVTVFIEKGNDKN